VALGIMNVHPNYFGQGIARRLLGFVIDFAEQAGKPVRLVSSAMNLDSFSLYTRAGFVPRTAYQDMYVPSPALTAPHNSIRPATLADVAALTTLELELNGISREQDYRYFVENQDGIWHVSVWENKQGDLDGFLVSVAHPGSNMLGPGISRTQAQAAALIEAELAHHPGRTPVFLVPVQCTELVQRMYAIGARNCELHFAQVRGAWQEPTGVVMPTFMPETG
jgi:ribosomal protein S18 acetylase RimI-like enzyme